MQFQILLVIFVPLCLADFGKEWNAFVRSVEYKLDYGGLCRNLHNYEVLNNQVRQRFFSRKFFGGQLVDHFDPNNTKTWKQTYFVHKPLGTTEDTAVVIVGGEGPTGDSYSLWGELVDSQKYTGFTVAHRYYQPGTGINPTDHFNPKTDGDLLSAKQALADLALFIEKIVMGEYGFKKVPIVFGCSYPGSLTIWFREKYPHLSVGNLALSGPILAQEDYHQYLEVGEKAAKDYFPTCYSKLFPAKKTLLNDATKDTATFAKQANICADPSFKDWEKLFTVGWVQLSLQFAAGLGQGGQTGEVQQLCDTLDRSGPYALFKDLIGTSFRCKSPDAILQEAITAQDSEQGDPNWWWQKCTEFGWFKTHSKDGLFLLFPLDAFHKVCQEDFFVPVDKIASGIKATNDMYHGIDITDQTNLLILNGGDDPWHNASMPAYGDDYTKLVSKIIPRAHHCTFLNFGYTEEAKKYAREALATWLK